MVHKPGIGVWYCRALKWILKRLRKLGSLVRQSYTRVMKRISTILIVTISLFLTSCVVVDNTPGPNGRDGLAFFGIDFPKAFSHLLIFDSL